MDALTAVEARLQVRSVPLWALASCSRVFLTHPPPHLPLCLPLPPLPAPCACRVLRAPWMPPPGLPLPSPVRR